MIEKPKNEQGHLDKEAVKALYMDSQFIEWVPFAESLGWNPHRSRTDFPVRLWTDEKRKIMTAAMREGLSDSLFGRKSRWHSDILKYLDEMPGLCDEVKHLLEARIKSFTELQNSGQTVSVKDICDLARALKILTEAKASALLIDKWSFEMADSEFKNDSKQDSAQNGFRMAIIDKGEMTIGEIQKLMDEYVDIPFQFETN